MIQHEDLKRSYTELSEARQVLHEMTESEISAKSILENNRFVEISRGHIVGRNETEREACARGLLGDLYGNVAMAERMTRRAKLRYDCALNYVEFLRMEMRLLELEAYAQVSPQLEF